MHTENLGIERVIRNVLANPNIRILLLCGEDTRQLIGHLPGQSLESLFANGLDEKKRIIGAKGDAGTQLLSYLMFERGFTRELIALGVRDVRARAAELRAFVVR